MSRYWFKAKTYGYGTYPISWQGWVATLLLCLLIGVSFYVNFLGDAVYLHSITFLKNWLRYFLDVIMLSTLFLILVKDKVEGGLKWRWGNDD